MKPASSLLAKILSWFFLNLILVAIALAVFFAFQPQVNLREFFGRQGSNRLRPAGMLIAHDLNRSSQAKWSDVLARHAQIHQVNFALVLEDGSFFSSTEGELPGRVMTRTRIALQPRLPRAWLPPPPESDDIQTRTERQAVGSAGDVIKKKFTRKKPPSPPKAFGKKPYMAMRTQHPTRYWIGIRIPLALDRSRPPLPAFLWAVSDTVTGNGFFFDPLPWMIVAAAVILISVLLWIPMVRNITRPLARMTRATEHIAGGRFDVAIHEPRSDEIGRLANAINHMTSRLSAFVKGQKRFLSDVAHELGSPIARIQFGLGALEQRVTDENRQRVSDVMDDVDHMSRLVNELLAFSRAEMKTRTVRLKTTDLLPVVQEAVKRESLPEVNIIVNVDPEIRVVASAELLTRALANLVRNAVKYAGNAGPIHISAEKRKNAVTIEVRDAGPGVPEHLIYQLFEPFFRPEPSRDRDSGGVGLGLAIVKTCVETCRGTVSARNLKPEGFAVTIILKTETAGNAVP